MLTIYEVIFYTFMINGILLALLWQPIDVEEHEDKGFLIKYDGSRMWVEITDKEKYNEHLKKRLNSHLYPKKKNNVR